MEFVRLQTGRLKLSFNTISLDKELMELYEAYQPKIADQGPSFKFDNEAALPPVSADGTHLRRVFTNLLDNAVKFSKRGGGIVLSTSSDEKEIRISVQDQGAGISAEELPRIFDAFHRGKVGKKIEGFGLGLAAVKAIVEAHGGRVQIESVVGKGSTFTVILPRPFPPEKS